MARRRCLARSCLIGVMFAGVSLNAQSVANDKCNEARRKEEERHRDAMAENQKKIIDLNNVYNKDMIACDTPDNGCRARASKKQHDGLIPIRQEASDESARYEKAIIDINRGACNTDRAPATSATPPAATEPPILATGDQQRLFKLGAEMNVVAQDLAQEAQGNAGAEFLKGLADWANSTLTTLAQKPGVPLQQMAESIVDYLTNDNAANHAALLNAATQAEKQFEQNPARFIGQNIPNVLPAPGVLGKIPALRQLATVEKAAERIKSLSAARSAFKRTITNTLAENRQFGRTVGVNECFADNACFPTARAEAEMFRTDGPLNNGTQVQIRVHALEEKNMAKTSTQITQNLLPVGQSFTPRNPATFSAEQLAQIAEGNPISVNSPNQIAGLLESEGVGSQGLVFVGYKPTPAHVAGAPLGHVMNVQKPSMAPAHFVDKTTPGKAPVLDRARVNELWFFPMH